MDPPRSLCLLRLSALGDVTHVVPVVRRLRQTLPNCRLTWVVGAMEEQILGGLDEVRFITYRKSDGVGGIRRLSRQLSERFDALLLMQVSLRAGLVSTAVSAERRIGFDRARSRDMHGLFVNERIPDSTAQHVADVLLSFVEPLGVTPGAPRWDLAVTADAAQFARETMGDQPTVVVSPCSSHALRNWSAAGYAKVIDYLAQRYERETLLCGGRSARERIMEKEILSASRSRPKSLIGKDTLVQLLGVLQRAALVVTPDSGPAHMANAVGTGVVGLYAATDPRRSGPYNSLDWCVDRHPEACERYGRRPRWGLKIEEPGVMDLISVDDVIERIDAYASAHQW